MNQTRRIKILLVEDDSNVRNAVVFSLEQTHEIVAVETLLECRSKVNSGSFDILITDFQLPDGDGLDVLIQFRETFPESPAILITGSALPHSRISNFLEKGRTSFLAKPFLIEELEKVILNLIEAQD